MKKRHLPVLIIVGLVMASPVLANRPRTPDETRREREAAFVKTMKAFVEAEGLGQTFQPSYVCQNGKEVCGQVNGNVEAFLAGRPDFLPDNHNFYRAHPNSTCSYRGKSGSIHYSLHIVCYGSGLAGVHIDVRLPQGFWGNLEHNVRDVAENYFKIHALRIKSSHTSELKLARNFTKWWHSYQRAFPGLAPLDIPADAEEFLNRGQTARSFRLTAAGDAGH
jgi:hypothetical protein